MEANQQDTNTNNIADTNTSSSPTEPMPEEKGNIKPPIFLDETVTAKNFDLVDLQAFLSDIQILLNNIKDLQNLIEQVFVTKPYNLFEIINKYSLPYVNFFYDLNFISRELNIIWLLTEHKYTTTPNIEQFQQTVQQLHLKRQSELSNIDAFISRLREKNPDFYSKIDPLQSDRLKTHIKELLVIEEQMLKYCQNDSFQPGLIPLDICIIFCNMLILTTKNNLVEAATKSYGEEHLNVIFFNRFAKIDLLATLLNNLYWSFDINGLLNKKECDSAEWKAITEHYIRYAPFDRETIHKNLDKFLEIINIGYASMNKVKDEGITKHKFLSMASFGLHSARLMFDKKKAVKQSNTFMMKPGMDVTASVWNILDSPYVKNIFKVVLPKIKYKNSFFLKRMEKEIDINFINVLTQVAQIFNPNDTEQNEYIVKLFDNTEHTKTNYYKKPIKETDKKNDNMTNDDYVRVKLFNNEKITFDEKGDIAKSDKVLKTTGNTIIFHVHGGGFVSASPSSHQNYTVKWANRLQVPVFSIDYRLSPGVAFPKALDDVYQSYIWIIKYSKVYFNINFDDVIFAGDSAGANLLLALTYLLIIKKEKLPKVLFLFYPILRVDSTTLVPSYLNSLTDNLLGYQFMQYCSESYCGKNTEGGQAATDATNKFVSPLYMDSSVLLYLPPIRIYGGTCDPLRDDTFFFMDKLLKLQKDIYFYEFKYFIHGFLNFDYKSKFPECSAVGEKIIEDMRKYI